MLAETYDTIAPLNQLFHSFDLNKDGLISPDEKLEFSAAQDPISFY